MPPKVTLQVNVAPSDHPVCTRTLAHQLRRLAGQVDEILYVFDPVRSARRSRFAHRWELRRPQVEELLGTLAAGEPKARIAEVDDRPEARARVAGRYFGTADLPLKDSRGAGFYPYFFALEEAAHDHVLHLDADILLGGGSTSWVREAVALLDERADVGFVAPLAGAPWDASPRATLEDGELSARAFLVDRMRLRERLDPLRLDVPLPRRKLLKALVQGNPRQAPAEMVLSRAMRDAGLRRLDVLGAAPGLFTLHPPFRSRRFTRALPGIIARVEAGDVPAGQRGSQDINQALFDWEGEGPLFRLRRLWGY